MFTSILPLVEPTQLQNHTLSPTERIIFPLDFSSFNEARTYVEELKNFVGLFKVGWTLFFNEGFKVIKKIQDITKSEKKIFFDFKFSSKTVNDIPLQQEGVASVIKSGSENLAFITVHTNEGQETVDTVVKNFQTNGTKVLGITALTSLDQSGLNKIGIDATPRDYVLGLAKIAFEAGCRGVVCSGLEATAVKENFGEDFIVVTPGIRPTWSIIQNDDQRRIITPEEAIKNKADYLVIGRPIYKAPDHIEAAKKIAEEIALALEK